MHSYVDPIRMRPGIDRSAWGKIGKSSLISELGLSNEDDSPLAEAWWGIHPKYPTVVEVNGKWRELRELVGREDGFGKTEQYQFQLKVLSIAKPLSIQVHPNSKDAERLHHAAPHIYPELNPKPEIGIAVSRTTLFFGFRLNVRQLIKTTPELGPFVSENEPTAAEIFQKILHSPPALIEAQVRTLLGRIEKNQSPSERDQLFAKLAKHSDGPDGGLFAAYLMNIVVIEPGFALYIPPGTLHAYLEGDLIEVMRMSDFVVRAGLTQKAVDVKSLFEIVNRKPSLPRSTWPIYTKGSTLLNFGRFSDFQIEVLQGTFDYELPANNGKPKFLFVLNGSGKIATPNGTTDLVAGDCFLLPPGLGVHKVTGCGTFYRVGGP